MHELIPIAGMLTWVFVTALVVALRYGLHRQRQVTLRLAIEKGIDPATLNLPGMPLHRRLLIGGTIWTAVGLLVGLGLTLVVGETSAPRFVTVFGWIPLAVGLALLLLSRQMPDVP